MKLLTASIGARRQCMEYLGETAISISECKKIINPKAKSLYKLDRFFEAQTYFLNHHAQDMVMEYLEKDALACFRSSVDSGISMSKVVCCVRSK